MGCLAPGPDLLDEPIVETSPDLAFAERAELGLEDLKFADLPLWYATLVAPPTWDEPAKATEPEACTRLFWRATVARWPIARRQAWGDRANTLQDAGLGWKEAERTAFEEIMDGLQPARR
jgi:hypothetical protein